MLLTRRPPPLLASQVEMLWQTDARTGAPRVERVLPNGRFQLVVNLRSGVAAISGLRSRYVEIETAGTPALLGVVFHPAGARAFFEAPASDFFDRTVALDTQWPNVCEAATAGERFEIAERMLIKMLRKNAELHPSVRYALHVFAGDRQPQSVEAISKESGLSRRRFAQLFGEQVGMTPKLYGRLVRFRRVARQIAGQTAMNWSEAAQAAGYYDHAHLVHEFHDFCGMSPASYRAAERPFVNHIRLD